MSRTYLRHGAATERAQKRLDRATRPPKLDSRCRVCYRQHSPKCKPEPMSRKERI